MMTTLESLLQLAPFSIPQCEKNILFAKHLQKLTDFHYTHCSSYQKIINALQFDLLSDSTPEQMPFIPVRLFKMHDLLSVDPAHIVKTVTSSGTSGQAVSKIFLDQRTANFQTQVLNKITADFIGPKRLPMLIIDSRAVLKNQALFSARGAGIVGFSVFGRDITYALDENMQIDFAAVNNFCEKYQNQPVLLFGFTFMIWEYFYKPLLSSNRSLKLNQGTLIHGGGWKKLSTEAVDNTQFKAALANIIGIKNVCNYYGMVEQTGSIFMECSAGFLHCSIFSDVIMRDKQFNICDKQQIGMIELMSLLPYSYPGHIILSEDLGIIHGEDDCPCGRLGKYFTVQGRIKAAEIRGCSDTYERN